MLDISGINYWAVLLIWVINMGVGSFWYSPMGFGKLWSKLSGVDIMKMPKDAANRAISFVALSALVQSLVLAVVLNSLHVATLVDGLWAGVVLWAGLVAATTVGNTLYMRQTWKFWWVNASFFLVIMAVNSVILAVW